MRLPALIQFARAPGYAVPAVAGLALAIGATTSVFSVFSAMLLRSMGFRDPQAIVAIWRTDLTHSQANVEISYGDLIEWRKAWDTFDEVALASSVNLDFPLFEGGMPEHIDGTTVTGNFFATLGATPLAGRFFTAEDDQPGAPPRVILSHRLWRARFGGDYGVVGRQIRVGPGTAAVIGIARPEFDFPRSVDLWVPLRVSWPTVEQNLDARVFRSVARLRAGVTPEQARARLNVIAGNIGLRREAERYGMLVSPILDEVYGAARPAVRILLAAVLLVLLIACANAANLLLNRTVERRRELAIRAALGASRSALVRLLLSESVVVAVSAGVLGLAAAAGGVRILTGLAPADVPRIGEASLNLPVLAFGIVLTFATVLLFGAGPALIAARRDANEALKDSGRGLAGSLFHSRLRRILVGAEVALSAVLLVGAGSLARSFARLSAIDPGFRPERLLTFRITLDSSTQESRRAFYSDVLGRVRSLPGVESAAAVLIRPLSGPVGWDAAYAVEGQPPEQRKANPNGNYEATSPGYFQTMGIRLLAGRHFTEADTATGAGVVIIDEGTARRHWPNESAVGKRMRLAADTRTPWLTVVGVVGQVRDREWEAARPGFYVPYMQRAQHRSDFVVKTKGDPWALAAALRREVFAIDKNQPISNVTTMSTLVDAALARPRFNSVVMGALASSAILLAAIGLYGVLSYSVTHRTPEIGVRVAVGATPSQIARLLLLDGVQVSSIGLAVGLAIAAGFRSVLAAIVFQPATVGTATYGFTTAVLLLVALAASVAPALRAASIDPVRALR